MVFSLLLEFEVTRIAIVAQRPVLDSHQDRTTGFLNVGAVWEATLCRIVAYVPEGRVQAVTCSEQPQLAHRFRSSSSGILRYVHLSIHRSAPRRFRQLFLCVPHYLTSTFSSARRRSSAQRAASISAVRLLAPVPVPMTSWPRSTSMVYRRSWAGPASRVTR